MPLPILGGTKVADTAFSVANSCRFEDGDSAELTRTLGTPTDADKWTLSVWIKRGNLSVFQCIADAASDGNNYTEIYFAADDKLYWEEKHSNSYVMRLITYRKFRDPSAWYHIVFTYDSGNATAGNRMRIYVNGTEETSFGTDSAPSQDLDSKFNSAVAHAIGSATPEGATTGFWDGYMAEVVLSDGQAYAASDFGEFDEDSPTIWKPKDVSGLTFGNNGFYLDFEDSSNLGNDANGGTDWSESNLAAVDQATDTPTNSFCTLNSLVPARNFRIPQSGAAFSEGNCKFATSNGSSDWGSAMGTIGLTAGKWYAECKLQATSNNAVIGLKGTHETSADKFFGETTGDYSYYATDGDYYPGVGAASGVSYGDSYTTNDIIGVYVDLDNNKLYFAKNGTVQNSGTGISITDPASVNFGLYVLGCQEWNSGGNGTFEWNFGGCPAFAISSGNADANGYGNFEYDPSSGTFASASKDFLAICTKNLGSDGG